MPMAAITTISTEKQQCKRPEQQQPSELAKTYAPKIEVAKLAIRATAQTSLFPESISTSSSSTSPYHLSPLDWRRKYEHNQPQHTYHYPRHAHRHHYVAGVNESPPKHHRANSDGGQEHDRPSVPSSVTTTSTSAGKRVTFGASETFNYPDDPNTPPDSDSQAQDDSGDEVYDVDVDDYDYPELEAPSEKLTSSSTTPPSTIKPPALRLDPKIDPRMAILTTHRTKGYRFIQDEVLNQLAKRRQYQMTANTQWQPLPPSPSPSLSSPSTPPLSPPPASATAMSRDASVTSTSSLQSVETQLTEYIEKAKATGRHTKLRQQTQRASTSDQILPQLTQMNSEFGALLMSELDRITACHRIDDEDGDGNTFHDEHDGKDSADKKKHLRAAARYTEHRVTKVVYASVDDHHETSTSSVVTTMTASSSATSLPVHEPIWRLCSSQSAITIPLVDTAPQSGRLYIRVLAAENLDFPIDKEVVRCVLSTGAKEYASEYMPMEHTVAFGQDFYIDVEPGAEFTMTLQIASSTSQNEPKQQQQQLRKLFGKNHRRVSIPRGDSILRYVNRANGAIAQTRVSMESIMPQCRGRMCTASFALVNGWYRFARSGLISNKHKPAPERAVGKLTAKLFFLPKTSPTASSLPTSFAECEQGINILRDARHCWQTGYMSQLGGDLKFWRRRFYSLKGWRLFSYTDSFFTKGPRSVIDLSRATCVVVDNRIVSSTGFSVNELSAVAAASATTANGGDGGGGLDTQQQLLQIPSHSNNNKTRVRSSASSVLSATTASEDDLASCSVKNSFRIHFETGESVDFFCDSAKEREQWVGVLGTVIGRVPEWPEWIPRDDEENKALLITKNNRTSGDDDCATIHIPPAVLPAPAINQ